jgi:hypothetical protein
MAKARSALMPVFAVFIAGCASLSPEQCRHADWHQIGFADGARGTGAARIDDHAKACADVGVRPHFGSYMQGREQGLHNYCQAENGFSLGRRGGAHNVGECPTSLRPAFLDQYWRGQQLYMIESELAQRRDELYRNQRQQRHANERIAAIRHELTRTDLPPERRTVLLNDYNRLVDQKNALGREYAFLTSETGRLQMHFQMTLQQFGR